MSTDVMTSLQAYWRSVPALADAGLATLHEDAPDSDVAYPYSTVSVVGGRVAGRDFSGGRYTDRVYRVSTYAGDQEEAAALGRVVEGALDLFVGTAPALTGRVLVDFFQLGDGLVKMRNAGPRGVQHVWNCTYTYLARVAKA